MGIMGGTCEGMGCRLGVVGGTCEGMRGGGRMGVVGGMATACLAHVLWDIRQVYDLVGPYLWAIR